MRFKPALIIYYNKKNRYSFNALAGAIEKDKQVRTLAIYFLRSQADLFACLPDILNRHTKTIIAISFATSQIIETRNLLAKLSKVSDRGRLILIAGGPHPTGDPEGALRMGFDVIVCGEGEETFVEVVKRIQNWESFIGTKGIAYIDGDGNYIFTGTREWLDMDWYLPISPFFSKFGPIEITRGCPFACSYCQTSAMFGTKPRHRSVDAILSCAEAMKQQNLLDFRVITPNAFSYGSTDGKTVNLEQIAALLYNVRKTLGSRGRIFFGSFPSEVRPEHVTADTVNLVREFANNDNLVIGAQSGSQRMLNSINRSHDVNSIYSAVEITRRAGLKTYVDVIFGLPGETDEDMIATLTVIADLHSMGARIHAHTFMPLPQTPFKKESGGKISPGLRKKMYRLSSSGIIFGNWEQQEKIAATRTLESNC